MLRTFFMLRRFGVIKLSYLRTIDRGDSDEMIGTIELVDLIMDHWNLQYTKLQTIDFKFEFIKIVARPLIVQLC